MPSETPVDFSRDGTIAILTIANPPVNALSLAVRRALVQQLARAAADDGIEAVVLAGAGRAFVAGADLKEMDRPAEPPFLNEIVAAVDAFPKPTAAALAGHVLGGGLELALACRLRVAQAGTQLGFPEVRLGLAPGAGGTQQLMRLTDFPTAVRLVTSGRSLTLDEAARLGLVVKVDGPPVPAAVSLLRSLAPAGRLPPAVSSRKVRPPGAEQVESLRAEVRREAKGRAAAPAAFEMMVESAGLDYAQGLERERALFVALRASEEARVLRRLFLAERESGRLPSLAGVAAPEVGRVGIVGGGLMGCGIAYAALAAGRQVTLVEADPESLERARGRLASLLDGGVASGRLSAGRRADMEAALLPSVSFAALRPCDLVIEAVFEDPAVKEAVFRQLDEATRPGALLASNTSYLDLDRIAAAVRDPSRVMGLHFFSPAHVMRLVEVVRGARTAPATLAAGIALVRAMGKLPVVTGVCEGFCGNRINRHARLVAEGMVEDGTPPETIDAAMVAFGFPMGPFAVQDMAGLEIAHANRRLNPPVLADGRRLDLVERLVAAGRTGRRSGRGWYAYPEGARSGRGDPEVHAIAATARAEKGRPARVVPEAEIAPRLVEAMAGEARRVVAEGIVARAEDAALVLVHGFGFPAHKAGVLLEP